MRNLRLSITRCLALVAIVATTCVSSDGVSAAEQVGPSRQSNDLPKAPISERIEFEQILTALVQQYLTKKEPLEGQQAMIVPKVWYSDEGDTINIDLGKGFLPPHYSISLEERVNEIADILYYTEKPTEIFRVSVWFDGKDIFDYFPEERGPTERRVLEVNPQARSRSKRDIGESKVLVAAGHGIYYNSKYKDWRAQRDRTNGIVEDFITPAFARLLQDYLRGRSNSTVHRARSTDISAHPDSAQPWSLMAARYHIKNVLPEHAEIWNSAGSAGATSTGEREQDIRSRPLYANHLGVDALIHLHTNAASASRRGVEVFHQPNSSDSKRLGDLALCYMRESLRTNSAYADFPVALVSSPKNHGENRLAEMPSIIAEMGFHTNPKDAVAIQSYVFQDLAMRGLEKAYRMFKEGNGCETFSATYSEVTVVSDSTRDAEIVFGGFPRFPVKYTSTVAECPSGILCVSLGGRFATAETPRTITHSCSSSQPMTMKWNVTFTDADGVKAEALSTVHCQPKA